MTSIIKIINYKTIMVLLFIVAPIAANAQHPAVKDYYNQFDGHEDVDHIVLEGDIFKVLTWFASLDENDEEAQAFKRITDNLEGFDIVVVPKNLESKYSFLEVQKHIKKDQYHELINLREEHSLVRIYAQGEENQVRDMVIFVDDQNEYCIISLKGILNLDDLKYLASNNKNIR